MSMIRKIYFCDQSLRRRPAKCTLKWCIVDEPDPMKGREVVGLFSWVTIIIIMVYSRYGEVSAP